MIKLVKHGGAVVTIILGGCLICLLLNTETDAKYNYDASVQQDIKTSLFKEADNALKNAREVHADVLAPKNFGEAIEYFELKGCTDNGYQ